MDNLTPAQTHAKSLAVCYQAYMEAQKMRAMDDSHDAAIDMKIAIWGFALIRSQEDIGVILMPFHLLEGEVVSAEARFNEKKAAA